MKPTLTEIKRKIVFHCDKLDDELIGRAQVAIPCVARVHFQRGVPGTYIHRDGKNLYLATQLKDFGLFLMVYEKYWKEKIKELGIGSQMLQIIED
jgi:hypothetical protein